MYCIKYCIVLTLLCLIAAVVPVGHHKNIDVCLKHEQMRNPVVLVQTVGGSGSGVIIDSVEAESDGVFEYRVLTSEHVVSPRVVSKIDRVDSLTGETSYVVIDTGCKIIAFDHEDRNWFRYKARVEAEDTRRDLCILSFVSDRRLAVATIAKEEMLVQVRVFDEVFAVGCQLGGIPVPTVGIISNISVSEDRQLIVYTNTAQITPGSSGGGLFKKYGNSYYLIGIPFRTSIAYNNQFVPHMAQAISICVAIDFIEESAVSTP